MGCRQEFAQPSMLGRLEDGSCPGFRTWSLERATCPRHCYGGVSSDSGQQRTLVLHRESSRLAGSSQLFLIQTKHSIHSAVSPPRQHCQIAPRSGEAALAPSEPPCARLHVPGSAGKPQMQRSHLSFLRREEESLWGDVCPGETEQQAERPCKVTAVA